MNRKSIILMALLLVTGMVTWYILGKKGNTTVKGNDWEFAVKDTANIGRIFIADRNGKSILLERKADFWTMNKKYRANPYSFEILLQTIASVNMKYRLPRPSIPSVVKDLSTEGIKVEIYHKNGERLKTYYVGGTNMDESATYMIMEGSNEPYATEIPGFEGTLRVRYITDEEKIRDKSIFREQLGNIKKVEVDYPLQKNNSFIINKIGSEYKVSPFYPITPQNTGVPKQKIIESFLIGFESLASEGFENKFKSQDSLYHSVPFANIKVTNNQDVVTNVTFYTIFSKNGYNDNLKDQNGSNIVERYFARVNDKDLHLVQDVVFRKIFWGYPSFFAK
jgi:hypothetical protein